MKFSHVISDQPDQPAGTTAGQDLLEASLGGVQLSLRQIRLRFVVRAGGLKRVPFG